MDGHRYAGPTPRGPEQPVHREMQRGGTGRAVAAALAVCGRPLRERVRRRREEGVAGCENRGARPHRSPSRPAQAVNLARYD